MKSHLEELENNEAILLMYLYNELPPDDRTEVEQMLQTDAGMRAEYAHLMETNDHLTALMQNGDRQSPMPISSSTAERQIHRLMQQWNTRRIVETPGPVPAKRIMPIWLYPVAAAAMVLIGWLVSWGFRESPLDYLRQEPSQLVDQSSDEGPERRRINQLTDEQLALFQSFDVMTNELQDAEQQLQAIADRRDDGTPVLSMDTLTR